MCQGDLQHLPNRENIMAQRVTTAPMSKPSDPKELAAIREWAGANGHEVSTRGRISQAVREAYAAAR
jgi:hypothetical protein